MGVIQVNNCACRAPATLKCMDVGVTFCVIFYFGIILFDCQKQFGGYNSHDGLSRYEKKRYEFDS